MTTTQKEVHIISLGAGVQSSTLALMAAAGVISPMPECAIFADTGAEPDNVYKWLDWLESKLPFKVHRVSVGDLTETSTRIRISKKTGETYLSHNVPAYTINSNGTFGNYRRQCTDKHKLVPLIKKTDEVRAGRNAIVWIGISLDEVQRMKESQREGITHKWPLIDLKLSRHQCLQWMNLNGFPVPPRSACTFCPYHSNAEWLRLKTEDPKSFAQAVEYEKKLQETAKLIPRLDGIPFLHPKRVPISEVEFEDKNQTQLWNTMQNECVGMCGV